MAKKTHIKVGEVWKEVKNIWVKVSGVWKQKCGLLIKVAGTWKLCISYLPKKLANPTSLPYAMDKIEGINFANLHAVFMGGDSVAPQGASVTSYNTSLTRSVRPSLSRTQYGHAVAANDFYAISAGGLGATDVVDAYNKSFTRTTTFISDGRYYVAGAKVAHYALAYGGYNGTDRVGTVDAFDNSLARTIANGYAVQEAGGVGTPTHAVFGGGLGYSNTARQVSAFNNSLTFTAGAELTDNKRDCACGCVGPYAIFAGSGDYSVKADAYDASMTKVQAADMSLARSSALGVVAGGVLLVAGGYASGTTELTLVEYYDESLVRGILPDSLDYGRVTGMHGNCAADVAGIGIFAGGYKAGPVKLSSVEAFY